MASSESTAATEETSQSETVATPPPKTSTPKVTIRNEPPPDPSDKDPKTIKELSQALRNMGASTSEMVRNRVQTFRMAEGYYRKADVFVNTEQEGLNYLKAQVDGAKLDRRAKRIQKWNFATAPLSCFDKTIDDLLLAFIRWAKREDDDEEGAEGEKTQGLYNASKAFRRLESYATWMDNTGRDMVDPPLTTESIEEYWKNWNMKVSFDRHDRLVWWLDLSDMEIEKVKQMTVVESLRLFCWFAHFVLLDEHAQAHGMVFVENLGKTRLWNTMTLVPPKLHLKIDRLTIGTMPVKMKQLYVTESPQWAKLMIGMMQPFLSKKMKERLISLKDPKDLETLLGKECIPKGFVGCDGELERDIVWATFFAQKHTTPESPSPKSLE